MISVYVESGTTSETARALNIFMKLSHYKQTKEIHTTIEMNIQTKMQTIE